MRAGSRKGTSARASARESAGLDHDRDGDPDLLVLNGGRDFADPATLEPWRFYENRDGRFAETAARAGLAGRAWASGCAVGDVDGDGFPDLFVTTAAGPPNRLFRNRGDGTFEDRTAPSGLGHSDLSAGAAFGDLDGDGDLDLAVTRYLDESRPPAPEGCRWKGTPVMRGPKGYPQLDVLVYLNRGDGTFTDASERAGAAGLPGYGLGVLMLDAEGDGDADLYIANDSTPSRLFLNRGDATFEERGLEAGVALSDDGRTQAWCSPTAPRRSSTRCPPRAATAATRRGAVPMLPAEEPLPNDLAQYLDDVEREILIRALEHHRFNRTAAGISLGLSLRQMRYRMARLNVNVGGDLGSADRE